MQSANPDCSGEATARSPSPWPAVGVGRGASLNALAFAVTVAVTFLLAPFMLRCLGDASYGLLSVTWELGGYFGLFDFGLRSAINYYVARAAATGTVHDVRKAVRTAFWLLAAITSAGLALSWPAAAMAARFIERGPLDLATVRSVLWLGLVVFSLNLTGGLASSVLAGLRRFDWLTWTNIAGTLSTGILVFAAIHAGMGLFAVAFAQAMGTILPWLAQQLILRRWELTAGLWPPRADRGLVAQLTSYGSANLVMRLAELLAFQADQILIVQAAGPAAVAQYHVGRFLALHSQSLINTLVMVLAPYFTTMSMQGGAAEIRAWLLRLNRWIYSLAALMLAGVLALGRPFLDLWVGPRYSSGEWWSRSDAVLVLFAAAMGLRALSAVPRQYLLGTRQLRILTTALAVESVFIVAAGAVAIRWKGIAGVAAVKLVASAMLSLVVLVPYTLRQTGIRPAAYLRESLLPALLTGTATAGAGWIMRHAVVLDAWLPFFLATATSAAAGAAAFFSVCTAEDREFIFRKLRSPLG